ncbi:MAG: 4'-phosphopantetheinyl transferase superfamily protein [Planctomycetota bacterium]|nr:4'-phosphopantetheinyl transferase superfamily protein [Planctomycetota bacterium]
MSPSRIRHGIDLVHVPELRTLLRERTQFEERVFTEAERDYCNGFPDPAPHFAARFAAKEAALKALGLGLTPLGVDARLREVEVVRRGTAPTLALHGRSAREAARLGVDSTSVSLTHDGDHAMAAVILVSEEDA